jgi:urea transport system permease protein
MSKFFKIVQRYDLWIALFAAVVLIPSLYATGYISESKVGVFGKFLTYVIVAIGLDLVWGYTGILSLCQALFFCIGAYAMGMYLAFQGKLDINGVPDCLSYLSSDPSGARVPWFWEPFKSFPVALAAGIVLPAIVAGVFGFFAFRSRVRGVYFSIITQAITLAAVQFFTLNNMRLGGTNGVRLKEVRKLLGMDFDKPSGAVGMYCISVAAVVAVFLVSRQIVNSRLGRILVAIRDNESRLRFSGYQPAYYKMFIFAFAAAVAGIGGMLYIPQVQMVNPDDMKAMPSILIVVWVALGGRGTLSGAIVGTLIINFLYSYLTSVADNYWPLVLGGIAIFVVLFFPHGLVGLWRKLVGTADERRTPVSPLNQFPDGQPSSGQSLPVTEEAKA